MSSVQHLASIGIDDDWATPGSTLRSGLALIDDMIFLDVCATEKNRQFKDYFSKETDALKQEWTKNFFMNPPYSEVSTWMQYASHQVQKNKVVGLILTFAKTDTTWWHEFVEGKCKVYFVKGRIKFWKNGAPGKNSAPYPSCWIIMRPTKGPE